MSNYKRLSSRIQEIRDHYTVVVVGSGYGGGIAASRLARAGQAVCVLERGKERQPGEFPETEHEALAEISLDTPAGRLGPDHGLYDMRFFDDINVLVGNGLGGTSLINANVSIEAEPRVFEDERWPAALRADLPTRVKEGYRRAAEMLRPRPVPERVELVKLRAMEKSAAALGTTLHRAELNVTFDELPGGVNHVGVAQPSCIQCGDCVSGCNRGAKNSTLMNYLPDAVHHGAEIYTQVEVRRVSRGRDGGYAVHYRCLELDDQPELVVTADVVVLAAGTLGSTEILLRSREAGLPASGRIGDGFTGNGDVLGFSYNCDEPINGVGWGHRAAQHVQNGAPDPAGVAITDPVGPCITSYIDLRGTADVDQGILIEEGSLPGPIAGLLPAPLAAAGDLFGVDTDEGLRDTLGEKWRSLVSFVGGPYHGAMQNTQTYLAMTHEESSGSMALVDGRVRVSWPGVGDEPIFKEVNERLIEATRPLGGTFVRNPLWTDLFKHHLMTVHPLGGCAMAETAEEGVVNHKGQVFSGRAGGEVHEGLYVADGAVIPRPLGCNPLLTISALAERACALIAADRGWTIDYALPARAPTRVRREEPVGIELPCLQDSI